VSGGRGYGIGGWAGFADDLNVTPLDEGWLHYRFWFPAQSPYGSGSTGSDDTTFMGVEGADPADLSKSSDDGTMLDDAWSLRVQGRAYRDSWFGESIGHRFLEGYLYVAHADGYTFADGGRRNAGWGHIFVLRDLDGDDAPFRPQSDAWNSISIYWRLNTAGNNDGIVRYYFNGRRAVDLDDVRFCVDDDIPANKLSASTFTNGTVDYTEVLYDQIRIAEVSDVPIAGASDWTDWAEATTGFDPEQDVFPSPWTGWIEARTGSEPAGPPAFRYVDSVLVPVYPHRGEEF
jgi:hypothetical protein